MSLSKPSWLHAILDHWLINWKRGDLLSQDILTFKLRVPTEDIMIGQKIEGAIDWLIDQINTVWAWLNDAWDMAAGAAIWIALYGANLWDWFSGADAWVLGILDTWWDTAFEAVTSWVMARYDWLLEIAGDFEGWLLGLDDWFIDRFAAAISPLTQAIGPVLAFFDFVGEELVEFVNNPPGYIADKLGEALGLFLAVAGWPFLHAIEFFLDRIWEEEE